MEKVQNTREENTSLPNTAESPIKGPKKRKVESHEEAEAKGPKMTVSTQTNVVDDDDDIIYLNVGGATMACNRSTLCQVEGSFLASMFGGRWEGQLNRDRHGNIFLNFDPEDFKVILKYLRIKEISMPEYPPPVPEPTEDNYAHFYNLVNYLGLQEEFDVEKDLFNKCASPFICLSDGGMVAKHLSETEDGSVSDGNFVIGENVCESGCTQWRLKVMSMARYSSIFIGIIEKDVNFRSDVTTVTPVWKDKRASGWHGDDIWKNGKWMGIEPVYDGVVVHVGVTYVLTLDLDTMSLSLSNGRPSHTFSMILKNVADEADEPRWYLCIGFQKGRQYEIRLEQ